ELIKASRIPFTIVHATQFFEFMGAITQSFTVNGAVRATSARIQPIASEDIAAALADVALSKPANRIVEVAGPEAFQIDEIIRQYLAEQSDSRNVITDDKAPYFGVILTNTSLLPGPDARLAPTHFANWMRLSVREPHLIAG